MSRITVKLNRKNEWGERPPLFRFWVIGPFDHLVRLVWFGPLFIAIGLAPRLRGCPSTPCTGWRRKNGSCNFHPDGFNAPFNWRDVWDNEWA